MCFQTSRKQNPKERLNKKKSPLFYGWIWTKTSTKYIFFFPSAQFVRLSVKRVRLDLSLVKTFDALSKRKHPVEEHRVFCWRVIKPNYRTQSGAVDLDERGPLKIKSTLSTRSKSSPDDRCWCNTQIKQYIKARTHTVFHIINYSLEAEHDKCHI